MGEERAKAPRQREHAQLVDLSRHRGLSPGQWREWGEGDGAPDGAPPWGSAQSEDSWAPHRM